MHLSRKLWYVEQRLELLDEVPFILGDIVPIEFFQRIDRLSRYQRIEDVLFFDLSTIKGLVWSFDLDSHGWLSLLANGYRFVLALDGGSVIC